MAEGLKIQIGADVSQAVAGLQKVESSMQKTAASGKAFEASVGKTGQALGKIVNPSNQATLALSNLGRVAQDAPFGFLGIANNLNPLLESFQRLKATTGTTGGALKALASSLTGAGGIGFALSVVSSLAIVFGGKLFSAGKAAKEASEETKKYADAIKSATSSIADESAKVQVLISYIKLESTSRLERVNAIKELQRIAPSYFATLNAETATIGQVTAAYNLYVSSLRRAIEAKVLEKQLSEVIEKRLSLQKTLNQPLEEEILINGKLVKVRNAIYDKDGEIKRREEEVVKLRNTELLLADKLAKIKPPLVTPKDFNGEEGKIKPEKITVDDQLAQIIKLDNPIPVSATLDLKDIEIIQSADLLKPAEDAFSNIGKSLSKLVTAPKIQIAPEVTEGIKRAREEVLRLQDDAKFVAGVISGAFGQAFDQIAAGKNVFQAVGEALKQLVLDLIKAALQALIFRAIISAVPGGAALSGAGSGLNAFFGGFRAGGGPVSSGRAYVVGEDGPEIFSPSVSGSIIPNNQIGGFSGRSSFSSGSQRQIVRGQNIILASARTTRGNLRLGNG